ncbi:uncharacterized protein DSM5745_04470 [Aspergillus mulundensis]|uniref:Uncharacterized protein n=1 Tax=Aspergillus mulundensis TaxID=1810919 RepID=A0A3D8SDG8_9EURO|nr:hypothetical protein DSM5745_04470 [Aspergillus mulundensis]RDW84144.1 hypothetical protein DSM5745_04470 [Aspergillus mulundensis]
MADPILAERKRRRQQLSDMYEAVKTLGPRLSLAQLVEVNIQREEMSDRMTLLDSTGPQFFTPYKGPVSAPEIYTLQDYVALDEDAYHNARELAWFLRQYFLQCQGALHYTTSPPGVSYSDLGDFGSGDLAEYTFGSAWEVTAAWHALHSGAPHSVLLMRCEMPDGDALFHGEIKTAIRVMHGQLRRSSTRPHLVAPVLLFSAIGQHHVRIIEAYHDGKKLIVRTTPLIDMRKRDEERLIGLTRWCLGGPSSKSTT